MSGGRGRRCKVRPVRDVKRKEGTVNYSASSFKFSAWSSAWGKSGPLLGQDRVTQAPSRLEIGVALLFDFALVTFTFTLYFVTFHLLFTLYFLISIAYFTF